LLEFGNSHRFVYVKRGLAKSPAHGQCTSVLKQIGSGIIGSNAEEQGRHALDWVERNVYFVPSRKGKAVGWTHELAEKKTQSAAVLSGAEKAANAGPVVLYVVKVNPEVLQGENLFDISDTEGSTSPTTNWFCHVVRLCERLTFKGSSEQEFSQTSYKLGVDDAESVVKLCSEGRWDNHHCDNQKRLIV
jgi:hypothetical protein